MKSLMDIIAKLSQEHSVNAREQLGRLCSVFLKSKQTINSVFLVMTNIRHTVFLAVYLMYRSYGPDTTCEREQSGTSTVGRCGTQGGPPGRMILAQ